MKWEEIKQNLFEGEFNYILEHLRETEWEKFTSKEKMSIFADLQYMISSIDDTFCKDVYRVDFANSLGVTDQKVICSSDRVLIDNSLVVKSKVNPYSLLTAYLFELTLYKKFVNVEKNKDLNEEGKRIFINTRASYFEEWSNFYNRNSDKFYLQPIIFYSLRETNAFVYELAKYMNKFYGMDKYLNECVYNLMNYNFAMDEIVSKVEENYKNMEKTYYDNKDHEIELLNEFDVYIKEKLNEIEKFNDQDFYSLFSSKFINICNDSARVIIYGEFIRRALKGYERADELAESFQLGETKEYGPGFIFDNKFYACNIYNEFDILIDRIIDVKLSNDLLDEVKDSKFRQRVVETYRWFEELGKRNETVTAYTVNGYDYIECVYFYYDYYYKLVENALAKSKLFKGCKPVNNKGYFSKKEAYLSFVYDKKYSEIKEIQYNNLKEQVNKIGGRQ